MSETPARHSQGSPVPADPAQAEVHFRCLVETDPSQFDSWCQLGLLLVRQARYAEAVVCLERACDLNTNEAVVYHHLAACYQTLGRAADAADKFQRVVKLRPKSPEAHNNLGIALAQSDRRPEAVAAFLEALQLRPEFPEALNNLGIAAVESGDAAQAAEHFRRALSLHAAYPEAHNNLGLALSRLGQHDDAASSFRAAVQLRPGYIEAYYNLANLQRDRNALPEAVEGYQAVLRHRPDHRDARLQLAMVLARQGQVEEAIACFHQSLLFHPDSVETYNHLGVLLSHRDRLAEAAAAFTCVLRLKSDHAEGLNNLGNTLLRQQKGEEAVVLFRRALTLRPDYPQPHCNLGSALLQQGKPEEALGHYLNALRLQPDYVDAQFNLGNVYRMLGQPADAVTCYNQVLAVQPTNTGARLNLGVALSEQGQLDQAIAVYEEVLRACPDFAPVYNSLGVTRLHQGRIPEALAAFEEGLQRKADDPEVHLNRALTWLLIGDYESGWVEYEWRWKLKKATPCPHPQPAWDGSPLPNGTVLLWSEQGLGDTLQFARYAAQVKERVGTVLLDCPGPLRGLLAGCPGVDALVGSDAPVPPANAQAPLMSLPRLLGTTLANIPASVPYLFVDAPLRDQWREKVKTTRGLRVGIIWQGNPQFAGDRYRSVALERFARLASVPGVRLFSLQKGKGSEQLLPLAASMRIHDLAAHITSDFRDTAAALLNLDVLVSVDTSVAHLAGALGVPVWILLPFNPDWRWLLDREDSLWYPSARLFRQTTWGDWDSVFARVADALRDLARTPPQRRVSVELDLGHWLEHTVGQATDVIDNNWPGWQALRRAGVEDTPEVVAMAEELRCVRIAMNGVISRMEEATGHDVDGTTSHDLMREFVEVQLRQRRALARFSAWMAGDDASHCPS